MRPVEALLISISLFYVLLFQLQLQQAFFFVFMNGRLSNNGFALVLSNHMRRRRRLRRRLRRRNNPYAWTVPRPINSWFELHYNDPNIPDDYFRKQLRLRRDTFDILLQLLGPRMVRQDTRLREAITPEKVLALALYRLGHGNTYVTIGPVFNVGKATVIEAVQDVVEGLYEIRNDVIKFPETAAETAAAIETFTDHSDLPNIAGAIDGSHIRIKAPTESKADYFSRYQQYDFIIQAIVDGRMLFMDFACGFPGAMHDGRVLRRSTIFDKAEARQIITEPTTDSNGQEIGPYLVGDSAYPMSPWLIKPYPEGTRDRDEIRFNKELSSARVKVECAFGMLKSRWRVLMKRFDSNIEFAIKCTIACAVLHNICIRLGDEWEDDDDHNDPNPPNPARIVLRDGEDIREKLKNFIA